MAWPRGGIGRRAGLRGRSWQQGAGSTPAEATGQNVFPGTLLKHAFHSIVAGSNRPSDSSAAPTLRLTQPPNLLHGRCAENCVAHLFPPAKDATALLYHVDVVPPGSRQKKMRWSHAFGIITSMADIFPGRDSAVGEQPSQAVSFPNYALDSEGAIATSRGCLPVPAVGSFIHFDPEPPQQIIRDRYEQGAPTYSFVYGNHRDLSRT